MKTSQFVSFLRSLIVASSLVVALQQAPAATPRGAQVQSVSGGATYTIPGQPPVSIQPGAIIPEGATINTPPGATVDLFLGRGAGVVRVTQDSSVRIDSLEATETGSETITRTLLTLERGEVLGRV
ncbi:MAG: hypothetical protein FJ405_19760, partial [Verrucomicrobia bacterium]|nr:hypothetical protein [Verrucomicrobiota bacterium]